MRTLPAVAAVMIASLLIVPTVSQAAETSAVRAIAAGAVTGPNAVIAR